jgi:hypothetical protein
LASLFLLHGGIFLALLVHLLPQYAALRFSGTGFSSKRSTAAIPYRMVLLSHRVATTIAASDKLSQAIRC